MYRFAFFALGVLLFATVLGCGRGDAAFRRVSGIINFEGKPLEGATVVFVPKDDDGVAATGTTDAAGKYSLTSTTAKKFGSGAKPGQYFVKITKSVSSADPDQEAFESGQITYEEFQEKKARKGPFSMPGSKTLIPLRYANQLTSNLEALVEDKKSNEFNFDLDP